MQFFDQIKSNCSSKVIENFIVLFAKNCQNIIKPILIKAIRQAMSEQAGTQENFILSIFLRSSIGLCLQEAKKETTSCADELMRSCEVESIRSLAISHQIVVTASLTPITKSGFLRLFRMTQF
ncbi:CLUMA_CG018761, isoform A [Clunio marinus]|uniref:CLUMA_CG018761, isoform A n=1 Tax=Clunio marinus TaxID=568069 RepID=A0A1J1J1U6_9DIPT|nr:CLUMA_CG018761, isoform A [Clunio marinus]